MDCNFSGPCPRSHLTPSMQAQSLVSEREYVDTVRSEIRSEDVPVPIKARMLRMRTLLIPRMQTTSNLFHHAADIAQRSVVANGEEIVRPTTVSRDQGTSVIRRD